MAKRNDKLETRSTKEKSRKKAQKHPYYRQLKVRSRQTGQPELKIRTNRTARIKD